MELTLLIAFAAGVGIAAATGLRAFLPLLALGVAGRMGWIPLKPEVAWLAGNPALIALGVAAAVEILADKIPVVDHALDAVATVLRPAAAWLGAYAVLGPWPAPWAQLAAVALGGGALALHAMKAKVRLGSTAVTAGHANPVLSVGEDVTAFGLIATALLVPLLALAFAVAIVWALVVWRRSKRTARERAIPAHP